MSHEYNPRTVIENIFGRTFLSSAPVTNEDKHGFYEAKAEILSQRIRSPTLKIEREQLLLLVNKWQFAMDESAHYKGFSEID